MDNTAPRFDLPRISLWIALVLALAGTVGNTAWAFASVDSGAQLMSYVKAIALDVGMVALAATLAQRKRAGTSTLWLWVAVVGFIGGSMYANYLHGQTHLITLTAHMADWRPVVLSALLPLMLFALVEIVAHAPTARVAEPQPAQVVAQDTVTSDAPAQATPEPTPQPVAVTPVLLHCPNECGRSFASQQGLAGHLRKCNAVLATQPQPASTNGTH